MDKGGVDGEDAGGGGTRRGIEQMWRVTVLSEVRGLLELRPWFIVGLVVVECESFVACLIC